LKRVDPKRRGQGSVKKQGQSAKIRQKRRVLSD
jgi:hypothetical protein